MKFSATLIILCVFIQLKSIAQETTDNEPTKVIQFTGVVLNADSVYIPGVHIYTPVYGRGTSTNVYGFFSMPALEGDSLIISAIGYKKSFYKIPKINGQTLKAIISLEADTTELKEVLVYNLPPTAKAFKQAVLAMRLPAEYNNINENLSPEIMQELLKNLPADGSSNHQWFIQQQAHYQQTRYSYPVNPLLNPMAWVELFRSIKRGDFKNDD
ncbi:MAG: hypothetical protein ACJAT1_001899 [Marivirga sp.]|jgi:hypothetical protein